METDLFDLHLRQWVRAACVEWCWSEPDEEYHLKVAERLPAGLRAIIAHGLAERLVLVNGWTFTLKGLPPGKGPYRWFSQRKWADGLIPTGNISSRSLSSCASTVLSARRA